MYKEDPPCGVCLPELENENRPVYDVYRRAFGAIETIDVFKIMDLVGIKKEDCLYCLDLIQNARSEVMVNKQLNKKGVK